MRKPEREHLKSDALIAQLRERFGSIAEIRSAPRISLTDALMSGFAMFFLKDPSLLAFQERIKDDNLRSIFGILSVPSDTQMRDILDSVDPANFRPCFLDIFRRLQRGKCLEDFVFYQGCYLLSLDGTGYFSSKKVHCQGCLQRNHNGTITYSHQMLAAALVHPGRAEVIPLMPEPIIKQDGSQKNDCERNAAKRFLDAFRSDHPHLDVIVVEDGLSSNGPHILELKRHNMHFILGVKPGDHESLFRTMELAFVAGTANIFTSYDQETKVLHLFRWVNQVALNESHPELLVNFLEYWEIGPDKTQYFSWVTDLDLAESSVFVVMRGGRARWKIENETFNTLKNQGYHFEHNYGHGKKNLSVVFAMLMMLAFTVDQVQQISSPLFQATKKKFTSKRTMWDRMRSLFYSYAFDTVEELFEALLEGIEKEKPVLAGASKQKPGKKDSS